jgi:hypothetical protein
MMGLCSYPLMHVQATDEVMLSLLTAAPNLTRLQLSEVGKGPGPCTIITAS